MFVLQCPNQERFRSSVLAQASQDSCVFHLCLLVFADMAAPSAAPSMPVVSGWRKQNGPAKWIPGKDIVWDSMVFHKKTDTLMKFPRKSTSESGSDNMYGCFKKPQFLQSSAAFASEQSARTTEQLNGSRVVVWLSELGGALHHFDAFVTDSVSREILHPKVLDKWTVIRDQHDLLTVGRMLNDQDFPNEPRGEVDMVKAVKNVMQCSNAIRADWDYWAEILARGSCLYVDGSWLASLATLTEPGHVPKHMQGMELQAKSEAKVMLENPESMAKLKKWICAEVLAGHRIRSSKRIATVHTPGAVQLVSALVFSDSEGEPAGEDPIPALTKQWVTIKSFNPKKKKWGWDQQAKYTSFKKLCTEFKTGYTAAGVGANILVSPDEVKRVVAEVKEKIKQSA